VLGFGMGAGTIGAAFLTTGTAQFTLAEGELERVVLELGPAFGLAFILLRFAFTASLAAASLRASRRGNPVPLVCFGYAGLAMLAGSITTNATLSCLHWLFVGLILITDHAAIASSHRASKVRNGHAGARRENATIVRKGGAPPRSNIPAGRCRST
jgi:hypothetical protein